MKVILINGSPHEKGCTYTVLKEIEKTLQGEDIETEIFWIGNKPISGCMGCGGCLKTGRCIIEDKVNEFLSKVPNADGFVFGSPVHFAGCSGSLKSFMDRAFYGRKKLFSNKLATSVVCCRRAGGTSTIDQINKYFQISNMPIVSSSYWNIVFGSTPEQILKDEEGIQTMKNLAKNMAQLLYRL